MKTVRSSLVLVVATLALLPVAAMSWTSEASAAADVRVTERNGIVRIVGTKGDDQIDLCLARSGLLTLTVSGISSATYEFLSVRSVTASLSDGDDAFSVGCDEWGNLGPDLRVNMGRGDDALRIAACCVGPNVGRFTLTDPAGDTSVYLRGALIRGRADMRARQLTVVLGEGDWGTDFGDRVNIRAVEQLNVVANRARFDGPTRLQGGTGDDEVSLLNTTAWNGGVLTFIGGRGNDSFVERQDNLDILDRSFWFDRLVVNLGAGDDSMTLSRDLVRGDRLDGSAGVDELHVQRDLGARTLRFETITPV